MHLPSLIEVENVIGQVKLVFNDAKILFEAAPAIKAGIAQKRPILEILKEDAPEALAVVETLANLAFPGAGEAIQIIATILAHSHPMTVEEEQAWFERADGTVRDSAGGRADSW